MVSDVGIYRTVSVLIRERGDEAKLVTAQRADSFLEDGNQDVSAILSPDPVGRAGRVGRLRRCRVSLGSARYSTDAVG